MPRTEEETEGEGEDGENMAIPDADQDMESEETRRARFAEEEDLRASANLSFKLKALKSMKSLHQNIAAEMPKSGRVMNLSGHQTTHKLYKVRRKVAKKASKARRFSKRVGKMGAAATRRLSSMVASGRNKRNVNEKLRLYNEATGLTRAFKLEEALEKYTQVLEFDPSYAKALNNRGVVYKKLGRYAEAVDDYTAAIDLEPSAVRYYNRAGCQFELEQYEMAMSDFKISMSMFTKENDLADCSGKIAQCEELLAKQA